MRGGTVPRTLAVGNASGASQTSNVEPLGPVPFGCPGPSDLQCGQAVLDDRLHDVRALLRSEAAHGVHERATWPDSGQVATQELLLQRCACSDVFKGSVPTDLGVPREVAQAGAGHIEQHRVEWRLVEFGMVARKVGFDVHERELFIPELATSRVSLGLLELPGVEIGCDDRAASLGTFVAHAAAAGAAVVAALER